MSNPSVLSCLKVTAGIGLISLLAVTSAQAEETESRFGGMRFPQLFRKADTSATNSTAVRKPADDPRFVARARQLMSEALKYESQRDYDAALDSATKAKSIFEASARTSSAEWPANEPTPAEYIRGLERRLAAQARPTSAGVKPQRPAVAAPATATAQQQPRPSTQPASQAGFAEETQAQPRGDARPSATANAPVTNREGARIQRPIARTDLGGSTGGYMPKAEDFMQMTQRGKQLIETVGAAKDVIDTFNGNDPAEATPEVPAVPTKVDKSLQAARTVLDRLESFPTWQPVSGERPAPERDDSHEPPLPNESSEPHGSLVIPAQIPGQIDPATGIADSLVSPIPTHIENRPRPRSSGIEMGDNSPNEADHGSAKPLLNATNNELGSTLLLPSITDAPATKNAAATSGGTSLLLLGTIQTLSTFFGVLMALGVLLIAKGAFKKSAPFASSTTSAATAKSASAPVTQTAAPDVTQSVAPVTARATAATTTQPTTVAASEEKPAFRVVSAPEEDSSVDDPAIHQAAVVKSVFEQNVKLMESLHNLSDAA